jgi:hypothetical protein
MTWTEDPLDILRAGRLAIDEKLVSLRANLYVEQLFQTSEVSVVGAKERFDAAFWENDPLHLRSSVPPRHAVSPSIAVT